RSKIRVEQTELVYFCEWDCGLQRVQVNLRDHLSHAQRICSGAGRVLIFAPDVVREVSILGAGSEAGDLIEAFLIRPPEIVRDGLAKMKAVIQWTAGNVHRARVEGVETNGFVASTGEEFGFEREFIAKALVEAFGFGIRQLQHVTGLAKKAGDADAGPGSQS